MMKKILLSVIICAFALSFSQEAKAARRDYNLKTEGTDSVTGVVQSAIPSDLSRISSRIVIRGENGQEAAFELRPSAVIYKGTDGTLLSLKEIKAGDKVRIDYLRFGYGESKATGVKLLMPEEAAQKEEDIK